MRFLLFRCNNSLTTGVSPLVRFLSLWLCLSTRPPYLLWSTILAYIFYVFDEIVQPTTGVSRLWFAFLLVVMPLAGSQTLWPCTDQKCRVPHEHLFLSCPTSLAFQFPITAFVVAIIQPKPRTVSSFVVRLFKLCFIMPPLFANCQKNATDRTSCIARRK
jgi:hypothetical protein